MAKSSKQNLQSARKQGRQAMKMSAVARGKDNPSKRAKQMTQKNTSDAHGKRMTNSNPARVAGKTRFAAKKKA